ncbi:MAG: methyltransferase domain-containing protein [Candidatus Lokiarchaeota archaeon]|nr:methyltransferase domain-containing protein [Candidatus Lokiarchaeota archaeon]
MILNIGLVLRDICSITVIIIVILLFYLFVVAKIIRKIHPFPIPAFMTRIIDNPIRRKFIQKPYLIAERMNLQPGMKVIEIGPGKGNYTKAVACKILPDGEVYAIDIQESVINRLKKRLENEEIKNIIPMINDVYNLTFENESIDRIFAIACLPEIPNPVQALMELKRVLKPEGIISFSELFIDPDYPLRRTEKKWAKEAGLVFIERFGNFFSYQLNFGRKLKN